MDIEISIKDVHDENVVHTETYHLDSGEEKLVYDTSTDDLGATMLEVTARTNETKITELNSGCDGKLPVVIESDGSLDAANSVC